jgi:hypothetical protein
MDARIRKALEGGAAYGEREPLAMVARTLGHV